LGVLSRRHGTRNDDGANVSAEELDFVEIDRKLIARAVEALESAKRAGLRLVTAESCTGGLIATVLSEAPGAAEYLDGGFVTYTPEQKRTALELDAKYRAIWRRQCSGRGCNGAYEIASTQTRDEGGRQVINVIFLGPFAFCL
jgi:hypothetical protein